MNEHTAETFSAHCNGCAHAWEITLPLRIHVDAWHAAKNAIACPACAAAFGERRIGLDRKGK